MESIEDVEYACPFCETTYDNELLTRVHITRSADDLHKNHDGFMPETQIKVTDPDGTKLDELQRRPDELNTNELERADLPDEFDERKQRVLLIGAYRPNADYTELHERATAVLEEHDLEPVSYGTIRRWIREFYMPKAHVATAEAQSGDNSESLSELTNKQQAIVIARLADPDASQSELADRAGTSATYPNTVLDRASGLIDQLSERLSAGELLDEIVQENLSREDIERLAQEDLLGKEFFAGDLESVIAEPGDRSADVTDGPVNDANARVLSASPPEFAELKAGQQENQSENAASKPKSPARNGDSSPATTFESTETAPTEEKEDSNGSGVEDESPAEPSTAASPAIPDSEVVPKKDVEAIRDRIRFVRRVAEREVGEEDQPKPRARTQLALAREVEDELDRVLAN